MVDNFKIEQASIKIITWYHEVLYRDSKTAILTLLWLHIPIFYFIWRVNAILRQRLSCGKLLHYFYHTHLIGCVDWRNCNKAFHWINWIRMTSVDRKVNVLLLIFIVVLRLPRVTSHSWQCILINRLFIIRKIRHTIYKWIHLHRTLQVSSSDFNDGYFRSTEVNRIVHWENCDVETATWRHQFT